MTMRFGIVCCIILHHRNGDFFIYECHFNLVVIAAKIKNNRSIYLIKLYPEFGRDGKAGKILRNAIRGLLQNASDSRMADRLTQEMVKVIQEDTINARGWLA